MEVGTLITNNAGFAFFRNVKGRFNAMAFASSHVCLEDVLKGTGIDYAFDRSLECYSRRGLHALDIASNTGPRAYAHVKRWRAGHICSQKSSNTIPG